VRLAKLVLDEGLLPATLLTAEEKVLLSGAVGSDDVPVHCCDLYLLSRE